MARDKDSLKEKERKPWQEALRAWGILGGTGIYLAVVVGICIYLGGLVDEAFALGHKGRLVGAIIGFPVAIYSLYRQIKNL